MNGVDLNKWQAFCKTVLAVVEEGNLIYNDPAKTDRDKELEIDAVLMKHNL